MHAYTPAYNPGVPPIHHFHPLPPSLWARFAAFLSFLAVLSALVSPASMLAEEVRTGKLGSVCRLSTVTASTPDASLGDGGVPARGLHCEMCGSLAWALPLLVRVTVPSFAGNQVVTMRLPANVAASSFSLPLIRGPPAL